MLADVARHGAPRVETWSVDDTLLRVRLRALDDTRTVSLLEIDVVHAGSGRHIEQTLARSLDLNLTEARMLAYVWRGMTNDDIGQELRLKLGTVKSRLSRLYRRLGVRHRSAAVLRAAEVLA
jgi:ATP/maltotriose-dependent transcriptional regulator MalT